MKDAGKSQRLFPYFAFVAGMFLGWAGWSTPSFGQASETQPVTSPVISPPPPGEVIDAEYVDVDESKKTN